MSKHDENKLLSPEDLATYIYYLESAESRAAQLEREIEEYHDSLTYLEESRLQARIDACQDELSIVSDGLKELKKKSFQQRQEDSKIARDKQVEKQFLDYINFYTPQNIYDDLDKVVVGQEDAKRTLATVGYMHLQKLKAKVTVDDAYLLPRVNILLLGPTGTGKTLLVKTLAKILQLGHIHLDATVLAPSGAADHSHTWSSYVDDYYHNFIIDDKYSQATADHGIIMIDEFDKMFRKTNSDGQNSTYYQSTRDELLNILEGHMSIKAKTKDYDLSNFLIICSGAFEEITELAGGKVTHEMGFHGKQNIQHNRRYTKEDLKKHTSISPELLGRLHVLTFTQPLTREEIKHALLDVHDSLVSQYVNLFMMMGDYDSNITDEELETLVDKLQGSDQGMRASFEEMFALLRDRIFEMGGAHVSRYR